MDGSIGCHTTTNKCRPPCLLLPSSPKPPRHPSPPIVPHSITPSPATSSTTRNQQRQHKWCHPSDGTAHHAWLVTQLCLRLSTSGDTRPCVDGSIHSFYLAVPPSNLFCLYLSINDVHRSFSLVCLFPPHTPPPHWPPLGQPFRMGNACLPGPLHSGFGLSLQVH